MLLQADVERAEAALREERAARAELERKVGAAEARIATAESGQVGPSSQPPPQRVTSPMTHAAQPSTQRVTPPVTERLQTADNSRDSKRRLSPQPTPQIPVSRFRKSEYDVMYPACYKLLSRKSRCSGDIVRFRRGCF